MTRYLELTASLAAGIAAGDPPPGASLPSVRELAVRAGTTPTTARRAYQELVDAGAVVIEPRRSAKVAAQGALAARALLRGESPFRLAGSDDPALDRLTAGLADAVVGVGASGSYRGLSALWAGRADGAALHLRHRSGEYNAPFASGLLRGRRPVLVHLWTREQGLLVPAGNPRAVTGVADLAGLRVARRPRGTGTRALHDRLLIAAGLDPERIAGPEVELHLDVALVVATGEADAGLGLRAAASPLELDFVPVVREPFQIATTEEQAGGLAPLLRSLGDPAVAARLAELEGYDRTGAGEILTVGRR